MATRRLRGELMAQIRNRVGGRVRLHVGYSSRGKCNVK